ncbi:MAG: HEAT repeat domain-containing protein [Polyangiales bacterium]
MSSSRPRSSLHHGLGWTIAALLLFSAPARAEDDTVLLRMLRDSPSFRVRVSAALAIGRVGGELAIEGLEAALLDPHAAVRAAAATALGECATPRSVPALRQAAADQTQLVADEAKRALRSIAARTAITEAANDARPVPPPTPPASDVPGPRVSHVRYAVVIGEMRNRSQRQELGTDLGDAIANELSKVEHIAVFVLAEMSDSIAQELARRNVPTFRLEGSVSRVETSKLGGDYRTRCEVSMLLMDEQERTLRGVMKGAATSSEQPRGELDSQLLAIARKTLKSAVRSAMSNVAQAIEAASVRRDLGMGDIAAEASLGGASSHRRAP